MTAVCYSKFSGTLVEILRRWLEHGKISNVCVQQTPGDMRGMGLVQFLLDGVIANCGNMRYLETLVRKKLHLPPIPTQSTSKTDGSAPVDEKGVEKCMSTIMKAAPPNSETPFLAARVRELQLYHPDVKCSVCRDKIALMTRIHASVAGHKEISLKVSMIVKETVIQKSSVCHGDCEMFKYRAVCILDACGDACIDTLWSNFSLRSDTCLAKLEVCEGFPLRSQTSLAYLVRCMLEGQVTAFKNWDEYIETMPIVRRLWQITQAFCELLYDSIKRAQLAVDEFRRACEQLQKVMMADKFTEDAGHEMQQFVACVGVAYTALAHALCLAWTVCGVPEDTYAWTEAEPSMRECAHTLIAKSGVVNLTEDTPACIKARRSCCSVAVGLRLLASHVSEHWPLAYRMISILQTTSKLLQDADGIVEARSLMKQACTLMDSKIMKDLLVRPLISKSVGALHSSIVRLEADVQQLPMALGKLEAKGKSPEYAAASSSSSTSSRKHSCRFKADHARRHLREPIEYYDHEEHRDDAQRQWDCLQQSAVVSADKKAPG